MTPIQGAMHARSCVPAGVAPAPVSVTQEATPGKFLAPEAVVSLVSGNVMMRASGGRQSCHDDLTCRVASGLLPA